MTILGSLFERRSVENPQVPLSSTSLVDWLTGGTRSSAGINVDEHKSMQIAAVWRAVNLIAGTIGSLPFKSFREGTKEQAPSRILSALHPSMTNCEVIEYWVMSLLLWGNSYSLKKRTGASQMSALIPLHPSWVTPKRLPTDDTALNELLPSGKVFEILLPGRKPQVFNESQVFHIPGLGFDGLKGVSPIGLARQSMGMALAAEEYGARLFANGSLMSGILQTDKMLEQSEADALKRRWRDRIGGLDKAHEVAVLDAGAKFQPISIPPQDAQFIESRKFQVTEIARWFGVPPHMLYDVTNSTTWGSGLEQLTLGFIVFGLRTWITRIEQRTTREVLLDPTLYSKFMVEGLLRGDSAARANFYRTMREIGVFNVDEIRELEDRPPLPDDLGTTHLQPLNMAPLGSDGTGAGATDDG